MFPLKAGKNYGDHQRAQASPRLGPSWRHPDLDRSDLGDLDLLWAVDKAKKMVVGYYFLIV